MKSWYLERHAPLPGTPLCDVDDIDEGGVRMFTFGESPRSRFRMFLHKGDGMVRAYMNACPHFNVPLNLEPEALFTSDNRQFMCSIHYARFNIEDGHCTEGPCQGLGLEKIPLRVVGGYVYVGDA